MIQLIFAIFYKYKNHYLHLTYFYQFTLMFFLEQCFELIFNNFKLDMQIKFPVKVKLHFDKFCFDY